MIVSTLLSTKIKTMTSGMDLVTLSMILSKITTFPIADIVDFDLQNYDCTKF